MTLVLHWWYLPVAFLVCAFFASWLWPNERAGFMGWPTEGWSFPKMIFVWGFTLLAFGIWLGAILQ